MNKNKGLLVIILALIAICAFGVMVGYAEGNEASPSYAIAGIDNNTITLATTAFPAETDIVVVLRDIQAEKAGIKVARFNTQVGGNFRVAVTIPDELANATQIEIVLTDEKNLSLAVQFSRDPIAAPAAETVPAAPSCDYSKFPSFTIESVAKGKNVTITTDNFPANGEFSVKMGHYACAGSSDATKKPPKKEDILKYVPWWDESKAPQLWSPLAPTGFYITPNPVSIGWGSGVFANGFYWNAIGWDAWKAEMAAQGTPVKDDYESYGWYKLQPEGYPYYYSDTDYFGSWMGGKDGKKATPTCPTIFVGKEVGTYLSGDGAAQTVTYDIPADIKNNTKIHVRIEDKGACGFYGYNYFWNNDSNPASTGEIPTVSIQPGS